MGPVKECLSRGGVRQLLEPPLQGTAFAAAWRAAPGITQWYPSFGTLDTLFNQMTGADVTPRQGLRKKPATQSAKLRLKDRKSVV